jgi:invasion protein IalB
MPNVEKRLVLLAIAVMMTFTGAAAAQQQTPARPHHPAPAQHAAQVQPAQHPAPTAPAAASSESPQRTTATYDDWVLQCETRTGPPPEKICDMAQVTQVQGRNTPFSRVAVLRPVKGQPVKLIIQVPINASFAAPVRVSTAESDAGITSPFARCVPAGCFSEFELRDDVLKKFRAASGAGKISFPDAAGHDVTVPLSFKGFAQAYDALAKE